jgi:hypothetical protein
MKKILLVAAVAGLSMVSCKKDYTCTCTVTAAGVVSGTTSTTIKDTKSKAEDACKALSTSVSLGGVTSSTSCEIK